MSKQLERDYWGPDGERPQLNYNPWYVSDLILAFGWCLVGIGVFVFAEVYL